IAQPDPNEWHELLLRIAKAMNRKQALIVIDPLICVLPGAGENSAAAILNSLAPLRLLTQRGAAVLLLHHPRKGQSLDPRGSTALAAFVDILMELDMPECAEAGDRRRWLRARGRHNVAPDERLIELVPEGDDYITRNLAAEECADGWEIIRCIL